MFGTLIYTLKLVLRILELLIFIRVILSWIYNSWDNQFTRFVYQITEPVLAPVRSFIGRFSSGRNLMLDFSPLIVLIIIQFVYELL